MLLFKHAKLFPLENKVNGGQVIHISAISGGNSISKPGAIDKSLKKWLIKSFGWYQAFSSRIKFKSVSGTLLARSVLNYCYKLSQSGKVGSAILITG